MKINKKKNGNYVGLATNPKYLEHRLNHVPLERDLFESASVLYCTVLRFLARNKCVEKHRRGTPLGMARN